MAPIPPSIQLPLLGYLYHFWNCVGVSKCNLDNGVSCGKDNSDNCRMYHIDLWENKVLQENFKQCRYPRTYLGQRWCLQDIKCLSHLIRGILITAKMLVENRQPWLITAKPRFCLLYSHTWVSNINSNSCYITQWGHTFMSNLIQTTWILETWDILCYHFVMIIVLYSCTLDITLKKFIKT